MIRRVTAALLVIAFGVLGCWDDVIQPAVDEEEALQLPPGLHSYLTVSDRQAPPGGTITVTANLRVVGMPVTVAGYHVRLAYDRDKLEPIEAARLGFEGVQVVNLAAPEGVRAAGAAPQGFPGPVVVLVVVQFRVKGPDYVEGLGLALSDVTALEGFKPVAEQINLRHGTVLTRRYLDPEG